MNIDNVAVILPAERTREVSAVAGVTKLLRRNLSSKGVVLYR